jgi:23S rRNA pseudouridine2604 synthase
MCQTLGYRVVTLHRVRIMHITLDGLGPGEWRDLSEQERTTLLTEVNKLSGTGDRRAVPPQRKARSSER